MSAGALGVERFMKHSLGSALQAAHLSSVLGGGRAGGAIVPGLELLAKSRVSQGDPRVDCRLPCNITYSCRDPYRAGAR
jgi:hypothetical protein